MIFTRMMNSVNAGDAATYASLYAPDASIIIYGGDTLLGRRAIERYEVELLTQFPGTRLAFYDVWWNGLQAVLHYGVNGRTRDGMPMGHEGLLFYHLTPSGLIQEERRYLDSMTPMVQLGIPGAFAARALPVLPDQPRWLAAGSSSEKSNVAIIQAALTDIGAKNEEGFLASVAADVVIDEMVLARPFTGYQGAKSWLELWISAVPDATAEITSIVGAGEFVIVETLWRGTLTRPLGRLHASASAFAVHRALLFRLHDQKITAVSAFMNAKELAEATGQWPLR